MGVPQGFPKISAPFVDESRTIQRVWHALLISLWNRTGSSQGATTFSPGDIKASGSAATQDGWLVCDGSAVSRIDFPNLFAAIDTLWGPGDGTTTFNIPDFRDKTLLGAGTHAVGTHGGTSSVTLTTTNLPAHNHQVVDPGHLHTVTDPGHTHTITDPGHHHTSLVTSSTNTAGAAAGTGTAGNTGDATTGITVNSATTGVTVNSHTTGITTGNTGSGTPFSILPPFAAVTVLIKT